MSEESAARGSAVVAARKSDSSEMGTFFSLSVLHFSFSVTENSAAAASLILPFSSLFFPLLPPPLPLSLSTKTAASAASRTPTSPSTTSPRSCPVSTGSARTKSASSCCGTSPLAPASPRSSSLRGWPTLASPACRRNTASTAPSCPSSPTPPWAPRGTSPSVPSSSRRWCLGARCRRSSPRPFRGSGSKATPTGRSTRRGR